MDLSNLSLGDLRNLQEQVKQEMKKREQQEVQKAREQIIAIAQSVGVPLKDLISASGRGAKGAQAGASTGTVPSVIAIRTTRPSNGPAVAVSRNGSRNGSRAVNRWIPCAFDSLAGWLQRVMRAAHYPASLSMPCIRTGSVQFGLACRTIAFFVTCSTLPPSAARPPIKVFHGLPLENDLQGV
jgi:DNA-binding protein H-NS